MKTECLHRDGRVLPTTPWGWAPAGCHWTRDGGGPWLPITGRVPTCLLAAKGDPFTCDMECPGCVEAGALAASNGRHI